MSKQRAKIYDSIPVEDVQIMHLRSKDNCVSVAINPKMDLKQAVASLGVMALSVADKFEMPILDVGDMMTDYINCAYIGRNDPLLKNQYSEHIWDGAEGCLYETLEEMVQALEEQQNDDYQTFTDLPEVPIDALENITFQLLTQLAEKKGVSLEEATKELKQTAKSNDKFLMS